MEIRSENRNAAASAAVEVRHGGAIVQVIGFKLTRGPRGTNRKPYARGDSTGTHRLSEGAAGWSNSIVLFNYTFANQLSQDIVTNSRRNGVANNHFGSFSSSRTH